MEETIDGTQKLVEQESAIRFKEAKGYALKSLMADINDPPTNNAEFDLLQTARPKRIHLTDGPLPTGKSTVCSGNIYVESTLSDVIAYRD